LNNLLEIGFVPTMGALHFGHISLMKTAQKYNKIVISSIFVNPTQFSQGEDLDKYPRQLEADLDLLKQNDIDAVFIPNFDQIYPGKQLCHVEPSDFSNICEGKARPEFFRGVATIVCKLLNIVQPNNAYFGQKDISQGILIKRMVEDLNIPVDIKICQTIRESDGLAMSSRNAYLNSDERKVSKILYKALNAGRNICDEASSNSSLEMSADRFVSSEAIIETIEAVLRSEPLVTSIEYISVASHKDMKEKNYYSLLNDGLVLSSAVRIGKVRLIDNVLVGNAIEDILFDA
jgi:pantoate--beta-alanine ligase